jgi:hypothetical protein
LNFFGRIKVQQGIFFRTFAKNKNSEMIGGQRMMLETPQARNLVNMYFNNN